MHPAQKLFYIYEVKDVTEPISNNLYKSNCVSVTLNNSKYISYDLDSLTNLDSIKQYNKCTSTSGINSDIIERFDNIIEKPCTHVEKLPNEEIVGDLIIQKSGDIPPSFSLRSPSPHKWKPLDLTKFANMEEKMAIECKIILEKILEVNYDNIVKVMALETGDNALIKANDVIIETIASNFRSIYTTRYPKTYKDLVTLILYDYKSYNSYMFKTMYDLAINSIDVLIAKNNEYKVYRKYLVSFSFPKIMSNVREIRKHLQDFIYDGSNMYTDIKDKIRLDESIIVFVKNIYTKLLSTIDLQILSSFVE